MGIRFKIDVLEKLKQAGYSTYSIKKDRLLAESTVQKLRDGQMVSTENLARLCALLNCQPSDLIEYVKDE